MEKAKNAPQDNISLIIPVRIGYNVVEAYLQKKMIGEKIKVGDEDEEGEVKSYAEILGLSVEKSTEEDYDITLELEFKTLTSFFRNRTGSFLVHAAIGFDEVQQDISIIDFKLQGTGRSWFMNKIIQTIANTIMYDKLRRKMNFDFGTPIKKQLQQLNKKLDDGLEPTQGISLTGEIKDVRITEIIPGHSHFLIHVAIEGNTLVDVTEINF